MPPLSAARVRVLQAATPHSDNGLACHVYHGSRRPARTGAGLRRDRQLHLPPCAGREQATRTLIFKEIIMPSTQGSTSASNTTSRRARAHETGDAIAVLKADHANVKALFEQYEGLGERAHATKKKLATKICLELTKHATAEEELFYPAVRDAAADSEDQLDEALVEHASARDLIAQICSMEEGDDLYDAKVKVLSDLVAHHIEEEEGELFPKAQASELDLVALAEAIEQRKAQVTLPV
jgi:hemerythrin superfamily protein